MHKIKIAHAKYFGIAQATTNFYSLIDRRQKHSEAKNPLNKWSIDTYYEIAFAWIGKEDALKERVLKLEAELQAGGGNS